MYQAVSIPVRRGIERLTLCHDGQIDTVPAAPSGRRPRQTKKSGDVDGPDRSSKQGGRLRQEGGEEEEGGRVQKWTEQHGSYTLSELSRRTKHAQMSRTTYDSPTEPGEPSPGRWANQRATARDGGTMRGPEVRRARRFHARGCILRPATARVRVAYMGAVCGGDWGCVNCGEGLGILGGRMHRESIGAVCESFPCFPGYKCICELT